MTAGLRPRFWASVVGLPRTSSSSPSGSRLPGSATPDGLPAAARWGSRAEDGGVHGQLLSRARSGDDVAFEELVRPHQRELQAHCYRILGSAADAEDAFQESLTAAWKGLAGFEGRASFRTWL